MPSSPFSGLPTTHPSFLRHRYNEDDRPLGLHIKLTTPTLLPAWASLPTPPMSGTPPPEPPSDPLQSAGRRRKRQDSPPPTTQEGPASTPATTDVPSQAASAITQYGDPSRINRPPEQSLMPFPLQLPWESQPTYGTSTRTNYPQYPAPPLPGRPQISPRATRKTKAHVASACVNCKRKHLRCDETRPCRRCVQSGKEDTCKDVEHKKRGRPPLKPDESSSSRLASTGMSLPPLGAPSRIGPGSGLVPLLPTPTPARFPFPPYAAASTAPSLAVAQGHFATATRPPSFPPIHQAALLPSTNPQQPYGYANDPGLPITQYSNPLFPRRPVPSQTPYGSQPGNYGPNPFQLPPILPAPPGTNMDPAIAQQQRYSQPPTMPYSQYPPSRPVTTQPEGRRESGERESKRPKMDIQGILGPPK